MNTQTTSADPRTKLNNRIASMTDRMLYDAVMHIGGSDSVSSEERIVRSALLVEIENRFGDDEVDRLMDAIGM